MNQDSATFSDDAREAIAAAANAPTSWGLRTLRSKEGQLVVLAGETHLKLPRAHEIGAQLVDAFALRLVEGVDFRSLFLGRVLWVLLILPRSILRAATFGYVKGSTIDTARKHESGETIRIEELFPVPRGMQFASLYLLSFLVPGLGQLVQLHCAITIIPALVFRNRPWAWWINPLLGILGPRDRVMANGIAQVLEERPETGEALAIMGRAHLPGCEQRLIEDYGYRRLSL